ncbi:MAG: hypothetical protein MJH10_10120 [Epibacterium sp.]|nr:hypothetical protein [Epibacterium sp.]NQX73893.1 hypothetical protein [Epibacterium sp.]
MAEVAFIRPQGRIRVLFPDDMDMADARDAIVNHMAVAIMAQQAYDAGVPSNPPHSGVEKTDLKEGDG